MEVNGKFDLNVPLLEPQDSVTVNICPPSPCGDGKIKMVEFKIKGIERASCSTSVESMLGKLNGIKSLVVSPMDGQTVVKYVPEIVDVEKLWSKRIKETVENAYVSPDDLPKLEYFKSVVKETF